LNGIGDPIHASLPSPSTHIRVVVDRRVIPLAKLPKSSFADVNNHTASISSTKISPATCVSHYWRPRYLRCSLNHLSTTPHLPASTEQSSLNRDSNTESLKDNNRTKMATKTKPSILVLSLLIIIISIFSSRPSFASEPPNSPSSSSSSSSRWAPRFLGRFSQPPNHNHRHQQQQQQKYRYETRYFSQRLDHFSFSELPNFPQRYLISTEHWAGPQRLGPIFLYCGNEGDIAWFAANTGFVWEIAPRFGAMVVFPEVSLSFFLCSWYWKTRVA
jgi:hypothetical protein